MVDTVSRTRKRSALPKTFRAKPPILQSAKDEFVAKPFLKWAGGKSSLLDELQPKLPSTFGRYFEPFVGGGALFFATQPEQAVLSDLNAELINCYQVVKKSWRELHQRLSSFTVSETAYYQVRQCDPNDLSAIERAARLIFLNKTCFNGLYRVNKKGQFNTPFGKYEKASFPSAEALEAASEVLASTTLLCDDYQAVLSSAKSSDFVYFDPPYVPLSEFSDFKRYTAKQFYAQDHMRLADLFRRLDKKGCKLMLSNSWQPWVVALFKGYRIEQVHVRRSINCDGSKRAPIPEAIIRNY